MKYVNAPEALSSKEENPEPIEIYSWYGLKGWEAEKRLHLHQLQSNSFVLSKLLFVCIIIYIFTLNWANIIYSVQFDGEMYLIFLLTIPPMIFLIIFVIVLHAIIPPEKIIHDKFVLRIMYLMILWIFGALIGIEAYMIRYSLCSPMQMMANIDCDGYYYPVEVAVIKLFLPVLLQHAFPNFGWIPLLIVYVAAFLQTVSQAVLSSASTSYPLITVTTIYSIGSLLTLRSEALKSYKLSLDIEERRSIEQEARLGQRLRTMISGVAHDLKSPLSALALGLESVKQLSKQAHTKLDPQPHNSPESLNHHENKNEVSEYNNIIEWMEATKDAMATIISRCVDVNQALSGLPLTPTYGMVRLDQEVNNIIQFYREESPQSHFKVSWRPHQVDKSEIPDVLWSNIVTDRVWFVQSLFCFVGNAIKFCDYSSQRQHEVEVHISIVGAESLESPHINTLEDRPSRKILRRSLNQKVSRVPSSSSSPFPSTSTKFIRIEVHDTGVGVSPDIRGTLFTFSGNRLTQMQVGGTGLGLYTMANRVVALGGKFGYIPRILATGEEKGSIFWFEVPYERDAFIGGSSHHLSQHLVGENSLTDHRNHHHHHHHHKHEHQYRKNAQHVSISTSSSQRRTDNPHELVVEDSSHRKLVAKQSLLITGQEEVLFRTELESSKSYHPPRKDGLTPALLPSMDLEDHESRSIAMLPLSTTASFITSTTRAQIPSSERNSSRLLSKETSSRSNFSNSTNEDDQNSNSNNLVVSDLVPTESAEGLPLTDTSVVAVNAQQREPRRSITRKVSFSKNTKSTTTVVPPLSISLDEEDDDDVDDRRSDISSSSNVTNTTPRTFNSSALRHQQHNIPPMDDKIYRNLSETNDNISLASRLSNASILTPRRVSGLHILVVDDSLPIRKMCAMILKQKGHIVETASNGKEGLHKMMASLVAQQVRDQLFQQDASSTSKASPDVIDQEGLSLAQTQPPVSPTAESSFLKKGFALIGRQLSFHKIFDQVAVDPYQTAVYDLVLMDIQMPVMDGIEAVTHFRAFEEDLLLQSSSLASPSSKMWKAGSVEDVASGAFSNIVALQLPIIAMSASSDSEIISQAIDAGMSHFLAKPFQMQQFDTLIAELVY